MGEGKFSTIAGVDSVQAMILAFEFVTVTLPAQADRVGGQVDWLSERESPIFAGTALRQQIAQALQNSLEGLQLALDMLDHRVASDTRSLQALRRLSQTSGMKWKRKR